VLAVVIIIGILSVLAYSNLTELVFTNRAKETAQIIRGFTEKALIDTKRQNRGVEISISGNVIIVKDTLSGEIISRETLIQGFFAESNPPVPSIAKDFSKGVKSEIRIGLSSIAESGYFAVCGFNGYCGGAVKQADENSFKAYIKKGNNKSWEVL
jgi:type II secretory pathway pseudopilin PulG